MLEDRSLQGADCCWCVRAVLGGLAGCAGVILGTGGNWRSALRIAGLLDLDVPAQEPECFGHGVSGQEGESRHS